MGERRVAGGKEKQRCERDTDAARACARSLRRSACLSLPCPHMVFPRTPTPWDRPHTEKEREGQGQRRTKYLFALRPAFTHAHFSILSTRGLAPSSPAASRRRSGSGVLPPLSLPPRLIHPPAPARLVGGAGLRVLGGDGRPPGQLPPPPRSRPAPVPLPRGAVRERKGGWLGSRSHSHPSHRTASPTHAAGTPPISASPSGASASPTQPASPSMAARRALLPVPLNWHRKDI